MSNVIALANAAFPEGVANPRIVKLLEGFLETAKRGEFTSIAIIAKEHTETARNAWHVGPGRDFYELIGAVAAFQARLTEIVNEGRVTLPASEDDGA